MHNREVKEEYNNDNSASAENTCSPFSENIEKNPDTENKFDTVETVPQFKEILPVTLNPESSIEKTIMELFSFDKEISKKISGDIKEFINSTILLYGVKPEYLISGMPVTALAELISTRGPESLIPGSIVWNLIKKSASVFIGSDYEQTKTIDILKNIMPIPVEGITSSPDNSNFPFGEIYDYLNSEIYDAIDKFVNDSVDAALYLSTCAVLGCLNVVEDGLEYAGAAVCKLLNNDDVAEKILSLNITDDLKNELDKIYGKDNWATAVSNSVVKFGTAATYAGLGILTSSACLPVAIGAGALMVLGKAGETTKSDMQKTGELNNKEMLHGLLAGSVKLACVLIGKSVVSSIDSSSVKIASDINKLFGGNVDPKLLKMITSSFIKGTDGAIYSAMYDIPDQVSAEFERVFDIDPEASGDWIKVIEDAGTAFLAGALHEICSQLKEYSSLYSSIEERIKQSPNSNGHWTGERGNSTFILDDKDVNKMLNDNGVEGICYKNGEVDFSEVSKGTVEIDNMTSRRYGRGGNFDQASAALSEKTGYSQEEIARWMDKNHYVWHECNDMKTMQKVPFEINQKFGHLGGVGECKKKEQMLDQILGRHTDGGVFDD